ncbi:hypothetical protein RHECNPAF_4310066 [Rhizobium etli CNPAF512]|nr:hypothetical protein RHECNPAF_4310066 [Rhizobium etli CNPAF512]
MRHHVVRNAPSWRGVSLIGTPVPQ